jgi:TetR/AcrR family transcriptional repressor of nem operon
MHVFWKHGYGPSPSEAITHVFERAVSDALDESSTDGCFLVNPALELSAHDEEVAELVTAGFTNIENGFRASILRGQEIREIGPDRIGSAPGARC